MLFSYIFQLIIFVSIFVLVIKRLWGKSYLKIVDSPKYKGNVGIWEQLKYCLPLGISGYVGVMGKQLDKLLISYFFTPIDYAVYSRGAIQIPFITEIPAIINSILMPKYIKFYMKGNVNELLSLWHNIMDPKIRTDG